MFLRLLLALIVFTTLSVCGSAHAQPVRISYGGTSGYNVPIWVTQDAGLFKKYSLSTELIFIGGAAPGMQAMLANEVHFANTSGAAPVNATLQGTDAVIIATSYDLIPYGFVVHKDIRTAADLKGKIVAISRLGGVTELAARVTFDKLGLNSKDMTLLQAGADAQRIPAVQSGNVAATVIAPPGLFAAVARGLRVLVDLTELDIKYPTSVFFVTRSYLNQNRPEVKKFLMAFIEGLHLYAHKRDFAIQVMKKYTKLDDPEVLSKSHDYFARKTLVIPRTDPAAVKNALPMGKTVNRRLEDFYDNSITEELMKDGFVEKISKAYR